MSEKPELLLNETSSGQGPDYPLPVPLRARIRISYEKQSNIVYSNKNCCYVLNLHIYMRCGIMHFNLAKSLAFLEE